MEIDLNFNTEEKIEFQLRLYLWKYISQLSKNDFKVLTHLFLYPMVEDKTKANYFNTLLDAKIRYNKISILNDINKYKALGIVTVKETFKGREVKLQETLSKNLCTTDCKFQINFK